jgi:hypothetical protein
MCGQEKLSLELPLILRRLIGRRVFEHRPPVADPAQRYARFQSFSVGALPDAVGRYEVPDEW